MNLSPRRFLPAVMALAVISTSLATVGIADSPGLDLKLGLWEITMSADMGNIGGQLGLSADQLAGAQAALSALGPAAAAPPKQICVTKEKLEKESLTFLWTHSGRSNSTCKQSVTGRTDNSIDGTLTCKGAPAPTPVHVEAASPTSVKGTMTATNEMRGRSMSVTTTATGSWVGADCGKIK